MNRTEFQDGCSGWVNSGELLKPTDVLVLAQGGALKFQPAARFLQRFTSKRLGGTITWLEITFFTDLASGEIEFFGVKICCLDQNTGRTTGFPPIVLEGEAGDPQPLDWEGILNILVTYNRNLPYPCAVPVVRIAVDEEWGHSAFYKVLFYDYEKFAFDKGAIPQEDPEEAARRARLLRALRDA